MSSVCPLPCTPAMARISPARTAKRHVVDEHDAAVVDDGEVLDDEDAVARRRPASLSTVSSTGAADHQRGELGVGGGGLGLADDLAEADDGDRSATSRTSRSLWVMKTIGVPGVLELAHDRHQLVGLLRGEHRGGLVEDEQPRRRGRAP